MFEQIIRFRIRTLISREGGGSLNSMRWASIAKKLYILQGGNAETKQGRKDIKAMTLDVLDTILLTQEQWMELFERVVVQSAKQM